MRTVLAACIALCLIVLPVFTASPPVARTASVPAFQPGEYSLIWGSTECLMAFQPDGAYYCLWNRYDYVGTWKLDGNTLIVREHIDPAPEPGRESWQWMTWKADVKEGRLEGGGQFRILKQVGKVH